MNSQSEAEKPEAVQNIEQEPVAKKREKESNQVLRNQYLAIQEYKDKKVRKFYQDYVEIETFGGLPIRSLVWVSDEKPSMKCVRKKKDVLVECDVCGKAFDEKRKLIVHMRCHKNKEDEKEEKIDLLMMSELDKSAN